MTHNALRTALLLAIAGTAAVTSTAADAALRLDPNGRGDAIYLPYYTVEDGQATLITVTNNGATATTARILFSESLNGQAVYYMHVFLPPYSQWKAAVTEEGSDGAMLQARSDVCHLPNEVPGSGPSSVRSFKLFDYVNNYPDGGPTGLERTRTGAIEILEFASLTGAMADEVIAKDCAALQRRYTEGLGEPTDRSPFLAPSTGQLSANAQVVDIAAGTVYSMDGFAISGFFAGIEDYELDSLPRITSPTLAAGQSEYHVELPQGRYAIAGERAADAVSALFMTEHLEGEVTVDPALGSRTDWIVSFPTRHAYVADLPGSLTVDGVTAPPFAAEFGANGACEPVQTTRQTLAGGSTAIDIEATLPAAAGDALCGQVNRRSLGSGDAPAFDGREAIDLRGSGRSLQVRDIDSGSTVALGGLPAVGVRVAKVVNETGTAGVTNYTFTTALRRSGAQD